MSSDWGFTMPRYDLWSTAELQDHFGEDVVYCTLTVMGHNRLHYDVFGQNGYVRFSFDDFDDGSSGDSNIHGSYGDGGHW